LPSIKGHNPSKVGLRIQKATVIGKYPTDEISVKHLQKSCKLEAWHSIQSKALVKRNEKQHDL
jgi:hypothetical protein